MSSETSGRGPSVDAKGNPVVDPSENVKSLSEAANRRQDDLRDFIKQLFDREITSLRRELETFAKHQRELDNAESERLDSIRQVDREEGNKTATQTLAAVTTLATQTQTTAETLRNQVATTALQAANQRAQDQAETNKRLSALELASSEGKGKQTVADPMLAEMVTEIKRLRETTSEARGVDPFIRAGLEDMHKEIKALNHYAANDGGKSQGMILMWAGVVAVIGIVIGLAGWLAP